MIAMSDPYRRRGSAVRKLLTIGIFAVSASLAASAQTTPVLVDKVGKLIGPIWPSGYVLITIAGQALQMKYDENGFDRNVMFSQYYEQPGCNGDAYLAAWTVPATAFRRDADIIISPGPGRAVRQIMSVKSMGQMPGMPPPTDPCSPADLPLAVSPIVETPIVQFNFIPPFSAQVR